MLEEEQMTVLQVCTQIPSTQRACLNTYVHPCVPLTTTLKQTIKNTHTQTSINRFIKKMLCYTLVIDTQPTLQTHSALENV